MDHITPHDALNLLVEVEIAVRVPYKGVRAIALSLEDLKDLYGIRTLVKVVGEQFGINHHLRISFGLPPDYLRPAMDRIDDLMVEWQGV